MKLDKTLDRYGLTDRVLSAINSHVSEDRQEEYLNNLTTWNVFVNARVTSRTGLCSHRKKFIEIHACLMQKGEEDNLTQTLLHEVAHMLVGPRHGHDYTWKAMMMALGAEVRRCSKSEKMGEFRKNKAKHVYVCIDCGYEYYAMRRWKNDGANKYHPPCRYKKNYGQLINKLKIRKAA